MKSILLALAMATSVLAGAQPAHKPHHDNSIHHSAMHAEHWVKHHANPPSRTRRHYPTRHHKDKSVHHAAMHAEHWIKHHASAPHH